MRILIGWTGWLGETNRLLKQTRRQEQNFQTMGFRVLG